MIRQDLLELTIEALTALSNLGFVKRAQKDLAAGLVPELQVVGAETTNTGTASTETATSGRLSTGTATAGTVIADFAEGVRTQLPAGRSLRDASCSCQASNMCRHRVMLVLAYQAKYGPNQDGPRADGPKEYGTANAGYSSPDRESGETAKADLGGTALVDPVSPAVVQRAVVAQTDSSWSPADFDRAAIEAGFSAKVLSEALRLAASGPVISLPAIKEPDPPTAHLPMCCVRFYSRHSLVHARCDCKQSSKPNHRG